jgi:hypothetical protein
MSGIAAYKTKLSLGGEPTPFTNEPLQILGRRIFRISDPLKRVLSANHPIVLIFEEDETIFVPIKEINYLEGIIFTENEGWSDLRISAHYIPLQFIGGSKEYSLEMAGDILDNTAFNSSNEGFRTKVNGLHDIKLTIGNFNDFSNVFINSKLDKSKVFISINPGESELFIKGWFEIETDSLSGDVGSLEEESLSLVLTGNNAKTNFSYSYNIIDDNISFKELTENYFPFNPPYDVVPEYMTISGNLTDGEDPLYFTDLYFAGFGNGNLPTYDGYTIENAEQLLDIAIGPDGPVRRLQSSYAGKISIWLATSNAYTPDLIPPSSWTPFANASGTPIITASETKLYL